MDAPVDLSALVPADSVEGEDGDDTRLLHEHIREARAFIESFSWCGRVCELWFGDGVGGIFAVVLARIEPTEPDVDEWLWIVTGDIPPLYLVTDDLASALDALAAYIEEARAWVDAVRQGAPLDDVMPVSAPADGEHADMLSSRLDFLEREILGRT